MLELQKSIENLSAEYQVNGTSVTITLKDICLRPLLQSDVCTVQSVLGYYQDSEENLDEEYDDSVSAKIGRPLNYLDWFIACSG